MGMWWGVKIISVSSLEPPWAHGRCLIRGAALCNMGQCKVSTTPELEESREKCDYFMFQGQMPREECLSRALKEGPQVGLVEAGKGKARQGKEVGKCNECTGMFIWAIHWTGELGPGIWGFEVTDRTSGLYLMENGKSLEALSRRVTGLISCISIRQVVEEVTSSYNPGKTGYTLQRWTWKQMSPKSFHTDALCDTSLY